MIFLEKTEVMGWEAAIRGMRNPMNSWDKSDSTWTTDGYWEPEEIEFRVGLSDHELMMKLAKGGPVHAKYRRMITIYVDITAPLYWWKEFDTYKVGTVANSCSTMHKIHAKEFVLDDFSHEHLLNAASSDECFTVIYMGDGKQVQWSPMYMMEMTIKALNIYRERFLKTNDKKYWWQMIQLLPSSYNQKRTVMLNYEVLAGIYKHRKDHKLDEWKIFCSWIDELPWSEIITCDMFREDI